MLLVFGRYLLVVLVARAVLNGFLVCRDLDAPVTLVDAYRIPRNKGRTTEPQEAHLHARVLNLVGLVDNSSSTLPILSPSRSYTS